MTTPLAALVLFLIAQDPDRPHLEDERRKELEQEPRPDPETQDFVWDWGGWLSAQYLSIEDEPFETERSQRFWDNRVWASAIAERRYRFYLRLRNTYQDFNQGDQFGDAENEWQMFRLDQGYVEASWPEFASSLLGPGSDLHAKAGRQYLLLGSGLVLNGVYDGIEADVRRRTCALKLFAAHTVVSDDDIDRSLPDKDDSHRIFVGMQADYSGLGSHRPYAMFLLERDRNEEDDPVQNYEYNAWYLGAGVRGSAFTRGFGYMAEIVYEGGTSPAAGTVKSEPISALAMMLGVEYFAPLPTSPLFFASFWYASGDGDRTSPTDSATGNLLGSTDTGFLSFGYVPTGFAVSPRVSNIRILRIGGTFKPLEQFAFTRTLELGFAFYHFTKSEEKEAITDPRSFLDDAAVGWELDVFMRWRLLSDLGASLNYGHFVPGGAYLEDSPRDFWSLGLTYSF